MNGSESLDEEASPAQKVARYAQIIQKVFERHWAPGLSEFSFARDELSDACAGLGIKVPKNLGDIVYTFRYRRALPKPILETQPSNKAWLILGDGDARYRFRLNALTQIHPSRGLLARKVPDATPEIISHYALGDEQALLARVRYNRLIDLFLGITAYSLQNHLRTKVPNYGQIEIDELYVGVDAPGAQYIVPVQAKAGKDILGVIQTIQDYVFCSGNEKYKYCICRPVSAQFLDDEKIALFETYFDGDEVSIVQERHYRLSKAKDIAPEDLITYRQ